MTLHSADVFLVNRTYSLRRPSPEFFDAAQLAQQLQQAMLSSKRAKLRSHKPTDKNILEGVEDCMIGDVERQSDATMMRKRLDIQDAIVMLRQVSASVFRMD
jgi:hypothetical protein